MRSRAIYLACLVAAVLAAALAPAGAGAHGGYPMSLGVQAPSGHEALARLVLVYLREGQGMTVQFLRYGTDGELESALREGKADMALQLPPGEWARESCGPAAGEEGKAGRVAAYFRERYPGSWSSAFAFHLRSSPCPPALVAGPRVVSGLRFSLLRDALQRLVDGVTPEDAARLLREGGGDPRRETETARRILREKGLL